MDTTGSFDDLRKLVEAVSVDEYTQSDAADGIGVWLESEVYWDNVWCPKRDLLTIEIRSRYNTWAQANNYLQYTGPKFNALMRAKGHKLKRHKCQRLNRWGTSYEGLRFKTDQVQMDMVGYPKRQPKYSIGGMGWKYLPDGGDSTT